MSPGRSLGTKEYGWPHLVQNPSVRPGRSPRARPTGAPQSLRLQNRLRSGTSGFSSTAVRGSGRGTSGTDTRPAPSLLRPDGGRGRAGAAHRDRTRSEPPGQRRATAARTPNAGRTTSGTTDARTGPEDGPRARADAERCRTRRARRGRRCRVGGGAEQPAGRDHGRQPAGVAVQLAAAHVLVRARALAPLAGCDVAHALPLAAHDRRHRSRVGHPRLPGHQSASGAAC